MEKYTVTVTSEYFSSDIVLQWNLIQQNFVCVASEPILKFLIGKTATKIKGYCADRNWLIGISKNQIAQSV